MTFEAGEVSKPVPIKFLDDNNPEFQERVTFAIDSINVVDPEVRHVTLS